ncbi:TIGR04222 domain-containing membrane protein [Melittangium boletus]|uniref:TIGR04222 domain-containing membrane protein n=1 Tax=Melittangium boletus TaxID=83453 RepID=UPI003DA29454
MSLLDGLGRPFLVFYGMLLFFALAAARVFKEVIRRSSGSRTRLDVSDLDPEQVALLRGRDTLLGAAVVELTRCRALRFEGGALHVLKPPPEGSVSPFEARVFQAVGEGHRTLAALGEALAPEFQAREAPLEARGLLRSRGQRWLRQYGPGVPIALLGVLGLLRLGTNVSRGESVGGVVALLLVALFFFVLATHAHVRRAPEGDTALWRLRKGRQPLRTSVTQEGAAPVLGPRDVTLAAGLFGVGALAFVDTPLREHLTPWSVLDSPFLLGDGMDDTSSCGGGGCGGSGCGGGGDSASDSGGDGGCGGGGGDSGGDGGSGCGGGGGCGGCGGGGGGD